MRIRYHATRFVDVQHLVKQQIETELSRIANRLFGKGGASVSVLKEAGSCQVGMERIVRRLPIARLGSLTCELGRLLLANAFASTGRNQYNLLTDELLQYRGLLKKYLFNNSLSGFLVVLPLCLDRGLLLEDRDLLLRWGTTWEALIRVTSPSFSSAEVVAWQITTCLGGLTCDVVGKPEAARGLRDLKLQVQQSDDDPWDTYRSVSAHLGKILGPPTEITTG